MSKVVKLETSNDNLLFIGFDGSEEFYLDMSLDFTGWSFIGLRAETEETLRERARQTDPRDLGFDIPDYMEQYFNYEKWQEDRESEWEIDHDVQAERENEESEILYLGFGTGTDIKNYFKEHGIKDYVSFVRHFEYVGLTKMEFINLIKKVGIEFD